MALRSFNVQFSHLPKRDDGTLAPYRRNETRIVLTDGGVIRVAYLMTTLGYHDLEVWGIQRTGGHDVVIDPEAEQ